MKKKTAGEKKRCPFRSVVCWPVSPPPHPGGPDTRTCRPMRLATTCCTRTSASVLKSCANRSRLASAPHFSCTSMDNSRGLDRQRRATPAAASDAISAHRTTADRLWRRRRRGPSPASSSSSAVDDIRVERAPAVHATRTVCGNAAVSFSPLRRRCSVDERKSITAARGRPGRGRRDERSRRPSNGRGREAHAPPRRPATRTIDTNYYHYELVHDGFTVGIRIRANQRRAHTRRRKCYRTRISCGEGTHVCETAFVNGTALSLK